MNIKELKNLIKDMPDDMDVFIKLNSLIVEPVKSVIIEDVYMEDSSKVSFIMLYENYQEKTVNIKKCTCINCTDNKHFLHQEHD